MFARTNEPKHTLARATAMPLHLEWHLGSAISHSVGGGASATAASNGNTWATQANQQGSFDQELGLWLILEYSHTVTHLFGPHWFKHLLQQHPHLLDVVHQHARLEKDTQESKNRKRKNKTDEEEERMRGRQQEVDVKQWAAQIFIRSTEAFKAL